MARWLHAEQNYATSPMGYGLGPSDNTMADPQNQDYIYHRLIEQVRSMPRPHFYFLMSRYEQMSLNAEAVTSRANTILDEARARVQHIIDKYPPK